MFLQNLRKKDSYSWVLILVILVTFLKSLTWTAIIPLWHTPDEAAHFSTIQKYAEKIDLISFPQNYGASKELVTTEQFLETERGDDGTTAFTFKPYHKIAYSQTRTGIFENQIKTIPIGDRKIPVYHEQAYYPPLYYMIGKVIYLSLYSMDIISRAFAIRLFSALTMVGVVIISYFVAKEFFPHRRYLQISLPIIISFHPMLNFVSAGINSDNLSNLLFSFFLLIGVYFITKGNDVKVVALLAVTIGIGFFVKPQFLILLMLVAYLFLFDLAKTRNFFGFIRNILIFLVLDILSGGFIPIQRAIANFIQSRVFLPYIETGILPDSQNNLTFLKHLENSFRQTIAQTLPWYWGVFKWLSLTLPRIVNQILMRVMLIGVVGLILKFIFDFRKKDFGRINQALLFLFISSVVFFFAIIWRDWLHIRANGFSLGIQGRYFFPMIIAHLTLLYVGLLALIPEKFKKLGSLIIVIGSIILNFTALYVVADSSYYLTSFSKAINQISQYKPFYFRGELLVFLFTLYLFSVILLLGALLKLYFQKSR